MPTTTPLPCRPGGCAGLCTDAGLRAAHDAYRRRMLALAHRVLADPHRAEEAVQEAFLRAWRSCCSFDPQGGPVLHWLLVITRNVAIDLVKARVRRPPTAPGAVAEESSWSVAMTDEDRVLLRAELLDALDRLGPEHRSVVVRTVVMDRAPADVALELGIPVGTVRSRVHYALRRLRDLLECSHATELAA